MKELRHKVVSWVGMLVVAATVLGMMGCKTGPEPYFADDPDVVQQQAPPPRLLTDVFQIGDLVGISFVFPVNPPLLPPYDERIRDDGTITPPFVGSVQAVGRTAGDLQRELQTKYEELYKNVQVTVKTADRFFHVDGEVVKSGAHMYLPETDIVKAIASAGGFTPFAGKSRIRLIRSSGATEIINYSQILRDPGRKCYVYPGDKVVVPRRWF